MATAVFLSLLSFSLNYRLALHLDRLKVFDQYNVLFNADPGLRLQGFTEGTGGHGVRGAVHPNIANFVNPIIRLAARSARLFSPRILDESALRRQAGLLVAPCAGAAQTFLLCVMFQFMGLATSDLLILGLLNIVAFSHVIFGSIPEHFILSGLFMTLAYGLAAEALYHSGKIRAIPWTICGIAMFGMTISTIVTWAVLLALVLWRVSRDRKRILRTVIKLASVVVVVNVLCFLTCALIYGEAEIVRGLRTHQSFLHGGPDITAGVDFLRALPDTFLPPMPRAVANPVGEKFQSRYRIMFTFGREAPGRFGRPLFLAVLALILLGLLGVRRGGPEAGVLALASVTIVLYNWLFHLFYGHEYFLYSQHWQTPLVFLLSGTLFFKTRAPFGRILLWIFIGFMAWNDIRIIRFMSDVLAGQAG